MDFAYDPVGSTATLTHDVKGNLTTNSNGHTYIWDFDSRLSSVDTDSDSIADKTFAWDALGRRVKIGQLNGTATALGLEKGWKRLEKGLEKQCHG